MSDRKMLMKCARALFELDQENTYTQYTTNPIMYGIRGKVSWDHITDEQKIVASVAEGYVSKAAAVIKAMREPTETQYNALCATDLVWRELNSYKVWTTYIDAILGGK